MKRKTDDIRRSLKFVINQSVDYLYNVPEDKKEATWLEKIMNAFKTNKNMLQNLRNALSKSAQLEESETKLLDKLKKAVYDKQVLETVNLEKRLEEIQSMGEAKTIKKMVADFFLGTPTEETAFVPKIDRLIKTEFSNLVVKTPKDLLYINPLLKMIRIADDLAVSTNVDHLSTISDKSPFEIFILPETAIS